MGCHRFLGYDAEPEELVSARQQIGQLESQRHETQVEIQRAVQSGDTASDNETARRYYTQAEALRVSISGLDGRIEQLSLRARNLMREIKSRPRFERGPRQAPARLDSRLDRKPLRLPAYDAHAPLPARRG